MSAVEDDDACDPRRALWHYRQCTKLAPANPDYWCAWGLLALRRGKTAAGLKALRRAYALALGNTDRAETAARQGRALPPRDTWERYALGRAYLQAGELRRAAEELDRAAEGEPQGLWPHFYQGTCAYRLGQYDDALLAFTVCVTLAPRNAARIFSPA